MKNDRAYLVGTITRYKDIAREPQMRLVGTRFKPGGFHHFFNYGALNEFTDKVMEFEKSLIPSFPSL